VPSFETLYYALKLGGLLLFCFAGGGWLIHDGITNNRGRVTFDAVFPGAAAITAGLLAVGLLCYLRWRGRADSGSPEPALPAPGSESSAAPDPARVDTPDTPWHSSEREGGSGQATSGPAAVPAAGLFELTPARRHLLLTGAVILGVIGWLLLRAQRTVNEFRGEVDAAGVTPGADERAQQARSNRQFVERQTTTQELGQIEQALEKGQKFARSAEVILSGPGALGREDRQRLDEATDEAISSLRGLQTRLDSVQRDESFASDHERVSRLRGQCSALLERLAQIRNKGGEAVRGKE
jgi:hypothetical protein